MSKSTLPHNKYNNIASFPGKDRPQDIGHFKVTQGVKQAIAIGAELDIEPENEDDEVEEIEDNNSDFIIMTFEQFSNKK